MYSNDQGVSSRRSSSFAVPMHLLLLAVHMKSRFSFCRGQLAIRATLFITFSLHETSWQLLGELMELFCVFGVLEISMIRCQSHMLDILGQTHQTRIGKAILSPTIHCHGLLLWTVFGRLVTQKSITNSMRTGSYISLIVDAGNCATLISALENSKAYLI